MFEIDKIPPYIYKYAHEHGIEREKLCLSVFCDRDEREVAACTYIFATLDKIYILSGTESRNVSKARSAVSLTFVENSYFEYDIQDIELLKLEELVSGSRFVAKGTDGNYIMLSGMTNFCKSSVLAFIKYWIRIKNGKITSCDFEIDEEDLPEFICCPKCGMRYPDMSRKVCPKCMKKGKLFSRFSVFLFKYKWSIALLVMSLVLLTATSIIAPYFSSRFFYDEVLDVAGEFYGQLLLVVGIVIVTRLLSQIFKIVNQYISAKVAAKIVFDLKKTIFIAIEKLSLRYFSARQTGGLMTQINGDANTIYNFFCDCVPHLLINIVQVVVMIIILFFMNPILALISLSVTVIYFLMFRFFYRQSRKLHARNYTSGRYLNSVLSDVLTGMRVVKAFSKEDEEIEKFNRADEYAAQTNKKLAIFNNYSYPFARMILMLGNALVLGIGGYMVIVGYKDFSYGDLMLFTSYVGMMYNPVSFFADAIDWTAACTNALGRLYEIIDTRPDISEAEKPIELKEVQGKVEFRDVEFSYTKNRKTIDKVSFLIEPEHALGIVGHTGAGKSTLANLLMRLYDCDSGEILVDGVNVKDLSFATLYNNIAIVSQETYLFIGTIYDNIKYANPNATHEEVIHAAKCAGAHKFIVKLPDAYDTKIGFGYKELSGGERQRISIARAILRNPKILILDEATAAMDTETERLIQNALYELTKGKTTITIAHRLSTLRDADRLIVIENGRAVEEGTHKELLELEEGVYKRLYTLQEEALKNAGIAE